MSSRPRKKEPGNIPQKKDTTRKTSSRRFEGRTQATAKEESDKTRLNNITAEERHARDRTDGALEPLLKPFYCGKKLTDDIKSAEDKWNLLPAFLQVKGLVKQHIDSFNFFVEVGLKKIVRANAIIRSDIDAKFWFKYTNIYVGRPKRQEDDALRDVYNEVTPNECRLRDMTYAAPIFVDIEYQKGHGYVRKKKVLIGRMPIMLRSSHCMLTGKSEKQLADHSECSIDPGGYFIVRGQEKVILVQEQLSKNRVLVESQKGIVQASVTSSTHERKSKSYVLLKKGKIYLAHNVLNEDIPIVIALKAMGIQADKEILRLVAGETDVYMNEFVINIEEAMKLNIFTQQQALEYIGSRIRIRSRSFGPGSRTRNLQQEALDTLGSVVLAHVSVKDLNFRPKALYVSSMARRVLMASRNPKLVDDRDYVGNKRLELAGQMLALLFEDHFKRFNTEFKETIDRALKRPNRASKLDAYEHFKIHAGHITNGMERAIATGNWNLKRFKMERAGVSHALSRLSYISALGMMTRITSQFEKSRKISGPRALQPSQFGMLCPADTPEGESCGLVKNLALMTHITTEDDERPIRNLIFQTGAHSIALASSHEIAQENIYTIFLNGTPVALTKTPATFARRFRSFRRMGRISEFVSIHRNDQYSAVHVATDEGRICRPLIIVERGISKVDNRLLALLQDEKISFDDFLANGLVEYVDVNEENDTKIAVYEKDIDKTTTHLEIEPFTVLGAVAGLIPFPHHNQSPRNTYQCAMGKQAIGSIAYNQFHRIDALLYLMVYPQKPLVTTRTIELVKYDKLPAGQNATVAVMSYSGYDIEDALVINKASCDRGFGRCQVFKKVNTVLKRYSNNTRDDFGPVEEDNPKHKNLGKDGIVQVGRKLEKGDSYYVKTMPVGRSSTTVSAPYKLPDPSYVDKVMVTQNESDNPLIKVLYRQTRVPEVGDKFSSRHGQKGVVGIIVPQEDLPFSDEGISPDIVMNPHGFPSRMTVGKMLELIAGKAGVLHGQYQYGTAFADSKVGEMGDMLLQKGFNYSGKDFMTCGISGESMPAYVFTGPVYYQKLKHMVADKMHARSTGPTAILTRQPMEGRAKAGGLRLGEMERDCLIAHGASQLLIERLMLSSDKYDCDVCETCGNLGFDGWCQTCKTSSGVVRMTIPYAAKLLIQELTSMNISAKLKLEDEFANFK